MLDAADVFGDLGRDDRFRAAFLAADVSLRGGVGPALVGLAAR